MLHEQAKNFKNVKYKSTFIHAGFMDGSIIATSKTSIIMELFKRDGERCHCCEVGGVFYKTDHAKTAAHSTNLPKAYISKNGKDVLLTVDHDILKSLEGKDHIDNYHVLCESCNLLRGNSFAEYSEFKEFYDKKKHEKGTIQKPNTKNYCHIDFIQSLNQCKNELKMGSFPNPLRVKFKEHYEKHNNLSLVNEQVYRSIGSNGINTFFTEFCNEFVAKKYNVPALELNKAYKFYPTNSELKISNFMHVLNSKFNVTLKNLDKTYRQHLKLDEEPQQKKKKEMDSFTRRIYNFIFG